jgi:hypothetical protein
VPDDVQKNFDAAQKANHSAELGMKLFKEKHPKSVGPAKGADDIEFGPDGGAGRSRRSPELPQRLPQKEKGRKSANSGDGKTHTGSLQNTTTLDPRRKLLDGRQKNNFDVKSDAARAKINEAMRVHQHSGCFPIAKSGFSGRCNAVA